MKLNRYLFIVSICLLSTYSSMLLAANGDTTTVTTHNQVIMVTNPSTGNNPYLAWGVFPSASTQYRKVILHLDYKCPPGMACGEWDYIDWVYLKRVGGVASPSKNMEFARYITPYGNSFSSTWHAELHLDVTDYSSFLHDSVEIEYNHTGYETNVGKGWLVSVYFELIEGTPVMSQTSFTQLWNGSFAYGNAADPIDNHLQPDTLIADNAATNMRIRILQSGHGNDNTGCSEFCSKTRTVLVNSNIVGQRTIWRTDCGVNPIYPQAGTWIYSRGNWCPGSWVFPDMYDVPVVGNSQYIVDMNMPIYTSASPSANYAVNAQVFQYGPPSNSNDASIEEVLSPTNLFEYSRMNPVCDNPKVKIRNNGSNTLTSATIKYGIVGQPESTYNWTGSLATSKSTDVTLANLVAPTVGNQEFKVYLADVNGVSDNYNFDDTARTNVIIAPVYDSAFVCNFKTNNQPAQNSYTLKNSAGVTLYSRTAGSLTANTAYRDTFFLPPGCYRFTFNDSGNDGLNWWANPSGGSGFCRFVKVNNAIIKTFNSDFGSQIFQSFTVSNSFTGIAQQAQSFSADVFPNPTLGPVSIELSLPKPQDLTMEVYNSLGQMVITKRLENAQHEVVDLDFSTYENGVYFAKIYSNDYFVMKEIVVGK